MENDHAFLLTGIQAMDRRFSETKLGALGEDVPEGRNRTDRGLSQGKLHYALGLREIRCSTRILFWGG